jgi:acetoacetyl-CoA synthetase
LASGGTVVLHEGSPFRYRSKEDQSQSVPDDLAIPRFIERLGITHFGTSAKYLSLLEQKGYLPREQLNLDTLEGIYSTGSPLAPSTFSWVYKAFPSKVNLGSITGGTDIVSLFGAPSPLSPVYVGEIQKLGLGMAVRAWDVDGTDVTDSGEEGDLVCVKAFPVQPVSFWGPDGAAKYKSSYFEQYGNKLVWHHGDFIRFNPKTGGLIMLGRSDGVLKPAGVRFGSSEIYNVILKQFPSEVSDALCVGRKRAMDLDEAVVLFLKMSEKHFFNSEFQTKVKSVIRNELSARHVPSVIAACPEIPVTSNGKK